MSNLLAELAGSSFAEQYNSVNVTGCRVKKEDMTMSVDLESNAFPCELPFAKLRAAIREKFGVSKIAFNIKYIYFKMLILGLSLLTKHYKETNHKINKCLFYKWD